MMMIVPTTISIYATHIMCKTNFPSYFWFDTFCWNVRYGENTLHDTLGSSIEVNCLNYFRTLHHTSVPVPYRTVPYRTVPYRTVRSTEIYVPRGNRACVAFA